MLAKRLARHGLAVTGGTLAAALSQNLASASVPTGVLSSTIKAVTLVAAGKAATGLISANVAALTEGVIKGMLLTKLKTMTAVLLMLSMVALTSVMVLAWGQTGPTSTGDKGNSVEKPTAKPEKPAVQAQPKDPPNELEGDWEFKSGEFDGGPLPQKTRWFWSYLTFEKDNLYVQHENEPADKLPLVCICTFDAKKSPKQIDIRLPRDSGLSLPSDSTTMLGVYEIKGDELKWCCNLAEKGERPTDFATKKGSGSQLIVYKKVVHKKVPAQPRDPPRDFTNSIGMKFVWIPPGAFLMGSPKEEEGRGADEIQHKVTLTKGFYMGVHLVTQEQWQAVMGNNRRGPYGEKNLPVSGVSWDDCQQFIKNLREKDKNPYRLPSEAEWEFACRAGTTTPFHFGETISTDQANYNPFMAISAYGKGKKGVYRRKATPVGTFPANAWGLHDMHGNLRQWCQDWYGDYPQKEVLDPQGPEKGEGRVVRGGSWLDSPEECRSARRTGVNPGWGGNNGNGLRVCFSLEQEAKPDDKPKNAEADKETPAPVDPVKHIQYTTGDGMALGVTVDSKSLHSGMICPCFKIDQNVVSGTGRNVPPPLNTPGPLAMPPEMKIEIQSETLPRTLSGKERDGYMCVGSLDKIRITQTVEVVATKFGKDKRQRRDAVVVHYTFQKQGHRAA